LYCFVVHFLSSFLHSPPPLFFSSLIDGVIICREADKKAKSDLEGLKNELAKLKKREEDCKAIVCARGPGFLFLCLFVFFCVLWSNFIAFFILQIAELQREKSELQREKGDLQKRAESLEKAVKNESENNNSKKANAEIKQLQERMSFLEEEKQSAEDLLVKSEKYLSSPLLSPTHSFIF
jgi:hypothetical protein